MHHAHRFTPPSRLARGFTLIELMIVVAIIAIIASIGFPAYSEHVRKGHRAAAQSHMMDMASRQGDILADSHSYAAQAELLGLVPLPGAVSKFYTITVATTATPPTFTITATPKVGTAQVIDGNLTLTNAGVKTPAAKW